MSVPHLTRLSGFDYSLNDNFNQRCRSRFRLLMKGLGGKAMKLDLEKFSNAPPYASELYGIYQPLLGWKSRLITRRVEAGINSFRRQFLVQLFPRFRPDYELQGSLHPREAQFRLGLGREVTHTSPLVADATGSLIAKRVLAEIERNGIENPDSWQKFTRPEELQRMLDASHDDLREEYGKQLDALRQTSRVEISETQQQNILQSILKRESVAAGALQFLNQQRDPQKMMGLMEPNFAAARLTDRIRYLGDLLTLIDPRKSMLASAVISPVGIVHLFRQYFFEFDTFLGPAVEHLWLSPGGRVELVEVTTRRTLIERTTETGIETTETTSKSEELNDELSDAVRHENTSNTKFGVSVNTEGSFSAGTIFNAEVTTGTTYDLSRNEFDARTQLHKATRRQSENIATELKRSIRTTFKSVTEVTDTRSRKYTIENTTPNLLNYELRRKMRQIGIQIQDYGTSLCWQTYVDKPGDELGVANLVHIAVPNDMPPRQHPQLLAFPTPYRGETIKYSYQWPLDDQGFGQGLDPEYFGDVIAGRFPLIPNPGLQV